MELSPPQARKEPFERTFWSDTVTDDYRWLEDRHSTEVLDHLRAENSYTDQVLGETSALRAEIYEEIKGRIKETDLSVPVIHDDWVYYSRTVEGQAYPIHCRRSMGHEGRLAPVELLRSMAAGEDLTSDLAGPEYVLLDENVEAGDAPFFQIGIFDVSPDHSQLLWGFDRQGDERFTAVLRDLGSGADTPQDLEGLSYGSAWATDNKTFFYIRADDANRPHQVWRHEAGTPVEADLCIHDETDERFFVGIGREKDDSYIQIAMSSKMTDEVWVVPADRPTEDKRLIAARKQGIEYSVVHAVDRFVILTNDSALNFRVVNAPEDSPGPANWTELVPASDDVTIGDIDVCRRHLTLYERSAGTTRIRLRSWETGEFELVDQPEEVSSAWPGANPDFESPMLRYGYSSMVTPPSVIVFDPTIGSRTVVKQQEVLGGYDSDNYRTERRWAEAADGTRIPVSLVGRSERVGSPGPTLLYAYGSYEASMDPAFSSARLSLLDRGFVFAIAHVRGGGEMGRQWYLDGKMANKMNTFTDVIAVADHLIDSGISSPEQLVLRGGSAGGLMAGAVMNLAPERFTAVVAQVPFVDALTTILNPELPLTVTEWEEWGNPLEDRHAYADMRAYSPIDNVSSLPYPSVLATAGLNDTRVSYWEAAKWVQKLRQWSTSESHVLLWTDLESGHSGPSGRYEAWKEEARILAYIVWSAGLSTQAHESDQ